MLAFMRLVLPRNRLFVLLVIVLMHSLSACQPEELAVSDNDSAEDAEPANSGDTGIALLVRSLNYTQTNPGPTQVVLDVRIPTEANVQLWLYDVLIDEWATGEACVVFPALTQCADYIEQTVAVMIENDGAKRFELTALKGG